MQTYYILSCFLLGVIVAIPLGPLAILMFNRGARRGFVAGFATGLGAVAGDVLFAILGLLGVLKPLLHGLSQWLFLRIGGVILCMVALYLFRQRFNIVRPEKDTISLYSRMLLQGFVVTICNPMVALFFVTTGLEVLLAYNIVVTVATVSAGVAAVAAGSTAVVASISFAGATMGERLSDNHIIFLQTIAAIILFIVGLSLLTGLMAYMQIILKQFL